MRRIEMIPGRALLAAAVVWAACFGFAPAVNAQTDAFLDMLVGGEPAPDDADVVVAVDLSGGSGVTATEEFGLVVNPDAIISTENVVCAVNSTFEVPIHAEIVDGVPGFVFDIVWDPDKFAYVGAREGAAIVSYAETSELPDCDIIVFPLLGQATVDTQFYEDEFEVALHGNEVLIMEFEVVTEVPGGTGFAIFDQWANLDLNLADVLAEDPILRGDTSGDGSLSLIDAVAIAEYVFLEGVLDCERAGDMNDDGDVDLLDVLDHMILVFLNPDGVELPECATDVTPDELECDDSSCE